MSFSKKLNGPPGRRKIPALETPGTLATSLFQQASRRGVKLPGAGAAILAGLDYSLEIELKNAALLSFWKIHDLPGKPEEVVRSPLPRHYRTTSKRRWRTGAAPGQSRAMGGKKRNFFEGEEAAALEPAEHKLIFDSVGNWLGRPEFAPLARQLNFIIIRGTYAEFMVIFNLAAIDRVLHRLLLKLVLLMRALKANIISAFLYVDPSRSPYYLETDRPRAAFPIKKLFGPERFRLSLGSIELAVPPTSFSQVNESMLALLLDSVLSMLQRGSGERLLDLYCGYGLFSLALRSQYREIFAVDASAMSIRAARDLVQSNPGRSRVLFKTMTISRNNLTVSLPPPLSPGEEDMILDPPRRGTDEAVIRSLAQRRPGRVLHLFCASEEIPAALFQWRRCGFLPKRVLPLDMFAGTPQLETLVLLSHR
jgi:tRNA/tmRNA/rRNA uracil-C5-methylase (TrmA/RlmC/RlmD family)